MLNPSCRIRHANKHGQRLVFFWKENCVPRHWQGNSYRGTDCIYVFPVELLDNGSLSCIVQPTAWEMEDQKPHMRDILWRNASWRRFFDKMLWNCGNVYMNETYTMSMRISLSFCRTFFKMLKRPILSNPLCYNAAIISNAVDVAFKGFCVPQMFGFLRCMRFSR